jgi:fatty acid desaturase
MDGGIVSSRVSRPEIRPVEWPTLLLAAGIYSGWAALTYWHTALPTPLVIAIGAWLVAWHSSLQHELIHGHPTRHGRVNAAIGWLPLLLWLPFERYRAAHLTHHRDERLTDPLDDPESAYVEPGRWQRLSPVAQALIAIQATLLGRLVIGPAWRVARFLTAEARGVMVGKPGCRAVWGAHLVGAALVICWLAIVCRMSLWFYVLAIVYPGTSLMLIRSFAEHRAAARVRERTAIVENGGLLGLLFLFNNLHAAHHERPALAWYALPGWYSSQRDRLIAANGGLVYRGYGEVFRRFLLRRHDTPVHPLGRISLGEGIGAPLN